MVKGSGGTRNYSNRPATLSRRRAEFDALMENGYDAARSYFDKSGGFKAVHEEHNRIENPAIDKSDEAATALAKKGYKVYLNSENSTLFQVKMPDGKVYDMNMDIKTINSAGNNTIESNIKGAITQIVKHERAYPEKRTEKHAVVLYQNTPKMDRKYVENQLGQFIDRAPGWMKRNVDIVIVVGANGNVHRHIIK